MKTEEVQKQKEILRQQNSKMRLFFSGILIIYLAFFALSYKILQPLQNILSQIGLGFQFLILIFLTFGLNRLFKYGARKNIKPLQNKIISNALQTYALIWLIIALILTNDLPLNLFELAH